MGENKDAYTPMTLANLLDGPTDIEWVVEPFIPPSASGLLAGNSGIGKTWLSLDMGLSIASGTPWLGRFKVQQGPVLIVDEENSELLLRVRLRKLLRGHGLDADELPLYFLIGKAVNLSPLKYSSGALVPTQSYDQLLETVGQLEPVLVIFDSLTRCHRANENSANEMAAVFANVKTLMDTTGASCLLNHHFRKSGGGRSRSGDRIRGSTDIRAFCDVTLLVDDRQGGCIITHDKTRCSEPIPSFAVDFGHDGDDTFKICHAGEVDTSQAVKDVRRRTWDWLQDVLSDGPLTRQELIAKLDKVCSVRTLDEVLRWRCENGFLDKQQVGKQVVYSLLEDDVSQFAHADGEFSLSKLKGE